MTTIQRTPWGFYLLTGLSAGSVIAAGILISALVQGRPIGPLLVPSAITAGAILAFALTVATLAYPPVSVDFASRSVRMRFRDVPISTITQAWRRIADGRPGAILFLRLVSTEGPRVRLLVAGGGFPNIDLAGRQALLDLVRTAPIEPPAEPAQAHSMRWQRVGVPAMVKELKRFGLDWSVGVEEETLRADAELNGVDPDELPEVDDRLR